MRRWVHFSPWLGAAKTFSQMTLVWARSWQCNQTHSKQLEKKTLFLWVITRYDMKRSRCVIWRGLELVQKANELPVLCFPSCLFKYWNTKSFRREIMLQGLQSKWDSLHENKFFQILGCEWVCVCVTSAKPAGIGSHEAAAATASTSMRGWWATWKYTEEAWRSNWVFLHAQNRAHVPFKVMIGLSCLCISLYPVCKSMGLYQLKIPDFTVWFNTRNKNSWYISKHAFTLTK